MRQLTISTGDLGELTSEVLAYGSSIKFTAHGSSMRPFIKDGDKITVYPTNAYHLKAGDVVLYHTAGGRLTAHRITSIQNQGNQLLLNTRGDASSGSDEPVHMDQVLGRVTHVQRSGKVFSLDTRSRRMMGKLWTELFPLPVLAVQSSRVLPLTASRIMRYAQSFQPYRNLAQGLTAGRVHYRHAADGDINSLTELFGYQNPPMLENPVASFSRHRMDFQDGDSILIAQIGDNIAASLTLARFPDDEAQYPDWWMIGLAVRLRYRGMGIGENLSRMGIKEAAKLGASRINLLVDEDNTAAINLYRKLDFRRNSIPPLDKQPEGEAVQTGRRRFIMSLSLL